MFNWWSSLGPEKSQEGEESSEKPVGEENKTEGDVDETSDDGKTGVNEGDRNKASELDYAKDMAKNVGSM